MYEAERTKLHDRLDELTPEEFTVLRQLFGELRATATRNRCEGVRNVAEELLAISVEVATTRQVAAANEIEELNRVFRLHQDIGPVH